MKHLKTYEARNPKNSLYKDIVEVDKYQKKIDTILNKNKNTLEYFSPFVLDKYFSLIGDNNYNPEDNGYKPYKVKRNKLSVVDAKPSNKVYGGINFIVQDSYTGYGYKYYILFTNDEVEDILLKQSINKYNL